MTLTTERVTVGLVVIVASAVEGSNVIHLKGRREQRLTVCAFPLLARGDDALFVCSNSAPHSRHSYAHTSTADLSFSKIDEKKNHRSSYNTLTQMPVIPVLFLILVTRGALSSETVSPSPPPPASNMVLETWEIALIAGCGTLALLMCAYSVYILMRRRDRTPTRAPVVDIEKGRVDAPKKKDDAPKKKDEVPKKKDEAPKKKDEAPKKKDEAPKKKDEAPKKKEETPSKKREEKPNKEPGAVAVKKQADNSVVTCPGGDKNCVGARKEGVQTIQPNNYPRRPKRDSASSRIGGTQRGPRVGDSRI